MNQEKFPLEKINFILIALSFAVIVIGFSLMMGEGSTLEAYNPDIFSTRRIVVAPTIAFLGFLLMIVAILFRSKKRREQ